jgi:hypothetical protein
MALSLAGYARVAALAGPKLDEFAVLFDDRRGGKDLEPARRAFPRLRRQDAVAFRAKLYGRDRDPAILVVGPAGLALIEVATMDIRDETEAPVIAGVVQDDQVILAGAWPETAPDGPDEPNAGFCWPSIDNAADIRKV